MNSKPNPCGAGADAEPCVISGDWPVRSLKAGETLWHQGDLERTLRWATAA